jgi:hypothetical protein
MELEKIPEIPFTSTGWLLVKILVFFITAVAVYMLLHGCCL